MKKYLILLFVLGCLSTQAQTYKFGVSANDTAFVLTDTSFHPVSLQQSYGFNTAFASKNTTSVYLFTNSGQLINRWNKGSNLKYLASTDNIDSAFSLLNRTIYRPVSYTSNTYVVDSGGTLVYVMDSNAILSLSQDTIGAGETKSYNPYSFGMAFEGASGSTDVTLGGSTMTYSVSTGNLPYNPSHRQPVTIDNTGLTSGRIRILYK